MADKTNFGALLKAYFLISLAGILFALTIGSLVQGLLIQLKGNLLLGILSYCFAWLCLGAAFILFMKGRKQVHLVMISQ